MQKKVRGVKLSDESCVDSFGGRSETTKVSQIVYIGLV